MSNLTRLLVLLTLTFSAAVLCAQTKPNFTGTWELNVAKSDLGGAPITKLTVQIDHNDPVFKYTAKGTADGQDFEETETLTTDGKASADSHGNQVAAHWEGTTLAGVVIATDGTPLYESKMTLSADGKTAFRDFARTGGDPQKRHEIFEKQ